MADEDFAGSPETLFPCYQRWPRTRRFVAFSSGGDSPVRMLFMATLAALCAVTAPAQMHASRSVPATLRSEASTALGSASVPFIANTGQVDRAVAFYAPTFAGIVFVTHDGRIVYSLGDVKGSRGWSLTETPVRARSHKPVPLERSGTTVSYFLGRDPSAWRPNIASYESVSLGEPWMGVHLALKAHGRNVERIFTVEPKADPSRIRMSVSGAQSMRIDRDGRLIVGTGRGDVTFTSPVAWQESDGGRRQVAVSYTLRGHTYGFRLGQYDRSLPVIIDPLIQSTYAGGDAVDGAAAIALRPSNGDVYIGGSTQSANFPGTAGGAQPTFQTHDAFVARFNSSLTSLLGATYLGGDGEEGDVTCFDPLDCADAVSALTVNDATGDVFAAGGTRSVDFPGAGGGAQPEKNSVGDGFIARLNPTLTLLTQSTFFGGSDEDTVSALAIHPVSGELYAAGWTRSASLPALSGGAQTVAPNPNIGVDDAFIVRMDPSLTSFAQSTLIAGFWYDGVEALSIHPTTGDIYAAGYTSSSSLPGTSGSAQPDSGGSEDGFISRLSSTLTSITKTTFLGGSSAESIQGMAIHPATGDVFVGGKTTSINFPGTTGGAQPAHAIDPDDVEDGFVARLDSSLTTLTQATYFGGNDYDQIWDLVISPITGEVYVAGYTRSSNLPGVTGGLQPSLAGGTSSDGLLARFPPALNSISQATYLGGLNGDDLYAAAISPASGDLYVTGSSMATDFPGTTGGAQSTNAGFRDGFIARVSRNLALASEPNTPPYGVTATATSTSSVTVSWNKPSGFDPSKYHVYRSSDNSTWLQVNGETTTGLSYDDTTVIAGAAYLYKVRSVNASNVESADSNRDLATTVIFTDPEIQALSTPIRRAHMVELRTAVDAVRQVANGGLANPYSYTDPTITAGVTPVRAVHVTDLRTALNAARNTIFGAGATFTDGAITAGATPVRRAHIVELRSGVQ